MLNVTVKNRQAPSSSSFQLICCALILKAVPYISFDSQEISVLYKKGSSAYISIMEKLLFFSGTIEIDPHKRNPCLGYK